MVIYSRVGVLFLIFGLLLGNTVSAKTKQVTEAPKHVVFKPSVALVILDYITDFRYVHQKPFENISLLVEGKSEPFVREMDLLFPDERGYLGFKPHPLILKAVRTSEVGFLESLDTKNQQNKQILFRKYKLIFRSPLKNGEERLIDELFIYFKSFGNFKPSKVNFAEDQKLRFDVIHRPATVYPLGEAQYNQHLGDKYLHSSIVHNYVIPPLSPQGMEVTAVINQHFTQSRITERMVEISHWGNVWEHQIFKLHNRAAEFEEEFSTNSFNPGNPHLGRHAFKDLNIHVPHGSFGLFFRDELGNISTAHPYHESEDIRIHLIPRTALLGNWNLTWDIAINTPASKSLFRAGNTEKYKLVLPVSSFIKELPHDLYKLQIALPQGAHIEDFKVQGYTPIQKGFITYTYSHLDLFGRPTLNLHFEDFLGELHPDAKVTIIYTFDEWQLWLKSVYLMLLLGVAFLLAVFLPRLDLSFGSDLYNQRYLNWKKKKVQVYLDQKKLEAGFKDEPSHANAAPVASKDSFQTKKDR